MDTYTNADAELKAIAEVIATIEHSQVNELPGEFLGLFRQDAIWTTAHGRTLRGLDEIAAFTRNALPGSMANGSVRYELVDVLFIRPDVAAVKARGQYLTLDGEPTGNPTSPLYVMAKEDGRWLLTANQNTFQLPE
ncbi:SgcJ/EcaC family oxidoreductase [Streptomyces sp. TRM66268-LWL]|uniref:SgcJ/EcaC family oxidoreductase n=1 Tax=Streptomyces polyasparticus TaxID=2767826 RepID=A0ABR7SMJ8_9ACTN|nr:SgcJ/EcaC family oxidoreductase [Streptomyces polyasparticus]MBC9716721.1 SgcJ/EcaC family oxidoreductase [Streptomyces polyasparticus]